MNELIKKNLFHVIALCIMFALPVIYGSPILSGKILYQNDIVQAEGGSSEVREYYEKEGEQILWTGKTFGGMPTYQLGLQHFNNVGLYVNKILRSLANPMSLIFICSLSAYIFFIAMGIDKFVSLICALGFGFCTFNFVSIEAGHNAKINALAYFPAVIGGVIIAYRKHRWLGIAITALFLNVHLYANHFQITYYLIFAIVFFGLIQLYTSFKEKAIPEFLKTSALLIVAALLASAPNVSRIWTTFEYSEETIRGGNSELTKLNAENKSTGLDKDYAMSWSYGVMESFTVIIPYFSGGASQEKLDRDSELAKAGVGKQVLQNAPTYWGDQPFTSGPVYLGAVYCFLFVFALFILKGPIKWWIISYSIFALFLGWGKNFELLSDFFFNNVPLFNKFRTPMMILSVLQFTVPFAGALALNEFLKMQKEGKDITKKLLMSVGVAAGIVFVFGILFSGSYGYEGVNDQRLATAGWPMDLLKEDRAGLLRSDAIRSLFFILATGAILFFYSKKKLKLPIAMTLIGLLGVSDLWFVNKRYVNNENFESATKKERTVIPTTIDLQIQEDKSHFRVFNLTRSPFNDGISSFHYNSIGGYHGAKLYRYQELIERHLSKNNMRVLNMLNTKYFIIPDQQKNIPVLRTNGGALGNAWIVEDIIWADNADMEMEKLNEFDPGKEVIIDARFKPYFGDKEVSKSSEDKVSLSEYHPEVMTYEANIISDQAFIVFSEIYYEGGNDDWKVYVDDEESDLIRVNYLLRGMTIPKGKHKIVMEFKPKSWTISNSISLISSFLLVAFVLTSVYFHVREKNVEPES